MSTLGNIGSYKCHFEMNLETAGNDKIKHLPYTWMIELYNWVTKPCLRLPYILCLLAMTKCRSYLLLAMWQLIVSNWRLACHMNISLGRCPVELAQGPSRVALVRGFAILEKSLDNLLEKFLLISWTNKPLVNWNLSYKEVTYKGKSFIQGEIMCKGKSLI